MGFLNQSEPIEYDPDYANAQCLEQALKAKGKLRAKNTKESLSHFRLLRLKYGQEKVWEVLNWYVNHIGEQYIPHAFSSLAFRKKFESLQDAMARTRSPVAYPKIGPPPKEYSDSVKLLSSNLGLQWPRTEKKDELMFLQVSINKYTAYVVAIEEVLARKKVSASGGFEAR